MLTKRSFIIVLLGALLLVVPGIWGLGLWDSETSSGTAHRVVLFAPGPGASVPFDDADLQPTGVVVVQSEDELMQVVDASTRVIILTPDSFSKIDAAWLRAEMTRGVLLGGLNVSQAKLAELIGMQPLRLADGSEQPLPPLDDIDPFQGKTFVSLLYASPNRSGGVARGGATAAFDWATDLVRLVERAIDNVEQARSQ